VVSDLLLALSNKGRLFEPTLRALSRAGIILLDRNQRALFARTSDPELRVIFVRSADIPRFVERNIASLGITGYDFVVDSGVDVVDLLDLEFGRAKVVVAVPERSTIRGLDEVKDGVRVATKLTNLAEGFFKERGIRASIVRISGAAEIMPFLGISDVIVDVAGTGTTLQAHGLRVVGEILDTSARLIASRESLQSSPLREKIMEIRTAFESVLRAEGKRLVMMNVPDRVLSAVTSIIPSMSGPTVARVESQEPMWEVYSVVDEKDLYQVVNAVKKAGARDILVVPIERIIS
jgi:ATP phosphoribosyltransferase